MITEIKKNNVLNLPNIDAGNPSFVEFLRLEIINSLNKINDKDQKGIKLFYRGRLKELNRIFYRLRDQGQLLIWF